MISKAGWLTSRQLARNTVNVARREGYNPGSRCWRFMGLAQGWMNAQQRRDIRRMYRRDLADARRQMDASKIPAAEREFVVIDEVTGGFAAASIEDIRQLERRMTESMMIPGRYLEGRMLK